MFIRLVIFYCLCVLHNILTIGALQSRACQLPPPVDKEEENTHINKTWFGMSILDAEQQTKIQVMNSDPILSGARRLVIQYGMDTIEASSKSLTELDNFWKEHAKKASTLPGGTISYDYDILLDTIETERRAIAEDNLKKLYDRYRNT